MAGSPKRLVDRTVWQDRGPAWVGWLLDLGVPAAIVDPAGGEVNERLLGGDPAAVPVLIELARRPEPVARQAAALGLGRVRADRGALADAALKALAADEDEAVRLTAEHALGRRRLPVEGAEVGTGSP